MPMDDPDFGKKLRELQSAVGFRFPANDFSNGSLARLLETTVETMSRKKTGRRRVTEHDWSKLTNYFDLAHFGFDPTMFAHPLAQFRQAMVEIGRKAQAEAKPNKARQDLIDLALKSRGRRLRIEPSRSSVRGGGIGAEPVQDDLLVLRINDQVRVKVPVPRDGFLFLLNDDNTDITCLMPSHYAPRLTVAAGEVSIPTTDEFPTFPVGGPPGKNYRIYALWFDRRPPVAVAGHEGIDQPPRDLEAGEFIELVEWAVQASSRADAVMIAVGDYDVRE